jgi:site-specific recombinase XerC
MKSNRPIKGSIHRKEPIRDHRAIEEIKKLLNGKKRDLALFVLAINSNLRACDLLSLIVDQVKNLQVGDDLVLREKKTKKIRRIVINRAVWHALNGWLEIHPQRENGQAPLYLSRMRIRTQTGPLILIQSGPPILIQSGPPIPI